MPGIAVLTNLRCALVEQGLRSGASEGGLIAATTFRADSVTNGTRLGPGGEFTPKDPVEGALAANFDRSGGLGWKVSEAGIPPCEPLPLTL